MKPAEEYLRAKVVGGKMLPYTKRMMIEVMEEYARDYAAWSLKDITKAYELEQEENIRLAEEMNKYSTALTKAQRRTKRAEDECTELLLKLTDARNEVAKLKKLLDDVAKAIKE